MLKFTLVVSWIFSDLMAETIWVRFSAGGAAVAEVAALPVVCALLFGRGRALGMGVAGLAVAAFGLHVLAARSRPSILGRILGAHALRLLALHPVAVLRALAAGCALSVDPPSCRTRPSHAGLRPSCPECRRCRVASRPTRHRRARTDGALCCAAEPAEPASRPIVPCAFAKPVPAINAAAATEIKKRLVI